MLPMAPGTSKSAAQRPRKRSKLRPFDHTPPEVVRLICYWTQRLREVDLRQMEEDERLARQAEAQQLNNPFVNGLGGLGPQVPPGAQMPNDEDEWSTDEEMPALEPIGQNNDDDEDDEQMPGLEAVGGGPDPGEVALNPPGLGEISPEAIKEFQAKFEAALKQSAQGKAVQIEAEQEDSGDDEEETEEEEREPTFELGLPKNALISLALVNRSFLHAARSLLYSSHIKLKNRWQAALFARTVLAPSASLVDGSPKPLAELVQRIDFGVIRDSIPVRSATHAGPGSVGRGGQSITFDLLNALPNLRSVGSASDMLKDAERVFDRMLRDGKLKGVEKLSWAAGSDHKQPFNVTIDRTELLASKMPSLRELVLMLMDSGGQPEKPISWALTSLALISADIDDNDLDILTINLRPTLRKLNLRYPSERMSRGALEKLAIRFGKTLTELELHLGKNWHPRFGLATQTVDEHGVARTVSIYDHPYPLDLIMSKFEILKTVKWSGQHASLDVFKVMPSTSEHVSWSGCQAIQPKPLSKLLRSSTFLPGLKTLNAGGDSRFWAPEERKSLVNRLEIRGCKFIEPSARHSSLEDEIDFLPLNFGLHLGPMPAAPPPGLGQAPLPNGAPFGNAQAGQPAIVDLPPISFAQLFGGLFAPDGGGFGG